jgi:hypothetical protein
MKKYKPGTSKRITTGGHLDINGLEGRKRVFPYTDHDASSFTPCVLNHPRLPKVLVLSIAMPVSAVILHYKHPAATQLEHHIEPNRPKGERGLVAMPGTNHVIEQREDLALKLGGRPISGYRTMTVPAPGLVTACSIRPSRSHASTITMSADISSFEQTV